MTSRFSTLAALVVTFASFTLAGCAADAEDTGSDSTESSISGREVAPELHAEEGAKIAVTASEVNDQGLRREIGFEAKVVGAHHPELTPVPGFAKAKRVERDQALEAVQPTVAAPNLDVDMPELGR